MLTKRSIKQLQISAWSYFCLLLDLNQML